MHSTSRGFSLVELSIVLVILGLLTGGILAGQSLIRAAELRAVSTEQQRYAAAIGTFRDKYFSIPGDMNNATSFGAAAWVGNGDGDGLVETTGTATTNEISLFWIHMAAAGLIEGSYTNIANTTLTAGTNNPRSKLNNAGWNVGNLGTVATTPTTTYFEGSYGNAFLFGGGTSATLPTEALKPEEAWNIDTKADDANPATGAIVTLERDALAAAAAAGCSNPVAATTTLAASTYALDQSGVNCALVIKTGY
ncbi:MAG: prepilin-type N-terminal cleavage/methylation domain-containing protein [Alphaproteobacteria bacterium]|nr:prepilin-type N-terminal cleavage/methylation domain-containing protein [Alphaproteobacteria bacterium]